MAVALGRTNQGFVSVQTLLCLLSVSCCLILGPPFSCFLCTTTTNHPHTQVRRPLPLSVLLGVLLDAHILGIEMPQERLIRNILADFEGWQVRGAGAVGREGQ